ncbi:hypothetical protein ER308_08810 [Egibacter rhizosphaerae]|uniref:Uncharacterized protein n=1 Tax=Egibacter rhizosphaerae TaxID=1670831 RepID=A0A411YEL7_9ACTN|nr:hypothetical protein [Egibacter rhizosphaerae]QBI19641.1 hypothetical protein ER308_08810 [Egibacter rhizosphaerae]
MGDEHEDHDPESQNADEDDAVEPAAPEGLTAPDEVSRGGDELADAPGPGEEGDEGGASVDAGGEDELPPPLAVEAANGLTHGHVTLHYSSRDVVVPFDGANAMRLLGLFQRRAVAAGPRVSAATTSSLQGWLVAALDGDEAPLAVSWLPAVADRAPRRSAVDPDLAVALL